MHEVDGVAMRLTDFNRPLVCFSCTAFKYDSFRISMCREGSSTIVTAVQPTDRNLSWSFAAIVDLPLQGCPHITTRAIKRADRITYDERGRDRAN